MVLHCDSFKQEPWNSGYQNAGLSQKLLLFVYFKAVVCFTVTRTRFFSREGLWSKYMLRGHSCPRSIYSRDLAAEHPCAQHHCAEEWDSLHNFDIKQ